MQRSGAFERVLLVRILPGLVLAMFAINLARPTLAHANTTSGDVKSAVVIIDSGATDLFIESLVRTSAEGELSKHGYELIGGAAVGGHTPAKLLACAGDLDCSAKALAGIAAHHVIFLSLRSDDEGGTTNFKIVARSFEVATGKALSRVMKRCPECQQEVDLATFTEQVMAELLVEAPADDIAPEVLATFESAALESEAAASADVAGTTGALGDVSSDNQGPTEGVTSSFRYAQLGKYAGLGLGIGALALGTTLILIDGPVIEDGRRQAEANDTMTAGLVSLGVGTALIGFSAWLWSIEDKHEGASIVPSEGGASIIWTGGFQ